MRPEPKELQIYKHFKGNLYQIITIAIHSETSEKLVIYRPLYKDAKVYARPLAMFLSEVDHKKYPNVEQKYRFELMGEESEDEVTSVIRPEINEVQSDAIESQPEVTESQPEVAESQPVLAVSQPGVSECRSEGTEPQPEASEEIPIEENAGLDPLLERFLDAESYEKKLDIFYLMKKKATKSMLSYVAMSLDIEVTKEDLDEQYLEILGCLKTMEKFECNRLRPWG